MGVDVATNGKPIESVWDFPRPPRIERVDWRIRVVHRGAVIVDAPEALRVLETSQAPAYYVPFAFVADEFLVPSRERRTYCEWKGYASYADIVVDGEVAAGAAWSYAIPNPSFGALASHWAFYAQAVDECWVDDERVSPNDGDFYGGWVTSNVTGPFKGGPGTLLW